MGSEWILNLRELVIEYGIDLLVWYRYGIGFLVLYRCGTALVFVIFVAENKLLYVNVNLVICNINYKHSEMS